MVGPFGARTVFRCRFTAPGLVIDPWTIFHQFDFLKEMYVKAAHSHAEGAHNKHVSLGPLNKLLLIHWTLKPNLTQVGFSSKKRFLVYKKWRNQFFLDVDQETNCRILRFSLKIVCIGMVSSGRYHVLPCSYLERSSKKCMKYSTKYMNGQMMHVSVFMQNLRMNK